MTEITSGNTQSYSDFTDRVSYDLSMCGAQLTGINALIQEADWEIDKSLASAVLLLGELYERISGITETIQISANQYDIKGDAS